MDNIVQHFSNFIENYDLENVTYNYERDWNSSWSDRRNVMNAYLHSNDKFCIKLRGYATLDDSDNVIGTSLHTVEIRKYYPSLLNLIGIKLSRDRASEFVDSIAEYNISAKRKSHILLPLWEPSKRIIDHCFNIAKSPQLIEIEEKQKKLGRLI